MDARSWRAFVAAALAGMVLGFLAASEASNRNKGTSAAAKYEYKAVATRSGSLETINEKLNVAAKHGWKLVVVDDGIAYYKRKL